MVAAKKDAMPERKITVKSDICISAIYLSAAVVKMLYEWLNKTIKSIEKEKEADTWCDPILHEVMTKFRAVRVTQLEAVDNLLATIHTRIFQPLKSIFIALANSEKREASLSFSLKFKPKMNNNFNAHIESNLGDGDRVELLRQTLNIKSESYVALISFFVDFIR